MNTSLKGFSNNKDTKVDFASKVTMLNPNAAEFVPSALRSTLVNIKKNADTRLDVPGTSGKAILGRSESNVSNNSDDEAHQYWRCQLPDDITPDFKVMGEEEAHKPGLSLASLSIHDGVKSTSFVHSATDRMLGTRQDMLPVGSDGIGFGEKMGLSGSTFPENQSSAAFMTSASWDKQLIYRDQHLAYGREEQHYNGDFLNDFGDNAVLEDATINPLGFLASQFPVFSPENLADVYYTNGCDLNLTIEILTQLELQVDGGFSQNQSSKASPAPNLSIMDFPALPSGDDQYGLSKYIGEDVQQTPNEYRSPASLFRGTIDFASAVRKLASQDSGHWKFEGNGTADVNVGSSRNPPLLASSYNGHRKLTYGDKLLTAGAAQPAPLWLETGEAVANIYLESREEARDFARLRNSYFEQARQAYLIGNKALAKELSVKGQYYNMQMKAAHGKARETIYRQRNPISVEHQNYGREQDRLIDLHGLHVSEAIIFLRHELGVLRNAARSSRQRLQVMICVGTGHHTKGSRTARLPVAVEHYLLEEGLHYTVPQPGLLRVVIY